MKIVEVTDPSFAKYGRIIEDLDTAELVNAMEKTPLPEDVVYEPSEASLEELPIFSVLRDQLYGELPIQVGYCNGHNKKLNALEYHRSSEIDIAATELILLLGQQQDIRADFTYDTAKAEAFFVPAGTAVELYATTLHYAHEGGEDGHLTAKNKWLLGHPEGGLPEGSPMGLVGENLTVD